MPAGGGRENSTTAMRNRDQCPEQRAPPGARPQSTPQAQEPQTPKHQPGTRSCMQMHMQPATEAAPLVTCCVNRHDGDIRIEAGGKNSTREGTTPNESDTCKTNEKKNETSETRCWK